MRSHHILRQQRIPPKQRSTCDLETKPRKPTKMSGDPKRNKTETPKSQVPRSFHRNQPSSARQLAKCCQAGELSFLGVAHVLFFLPSSLISESLRLADSFSFHNISTSSCQGQYLRASHVDFGKISPLLSASPYCMRFLSSPF